MAASTGQASPPRQRPLVFNANVALAILAISAILGEVYYRTFDGKCRSNEALSQWNIPPELLDWQKNSTATEESFLYLPESHSTLFVARDAKTSIYATHPDDQPTRVSCGIFEPHFALMEDETVCFNSGGCNDQLSVACYDSHNDEKAYVPLVHQSVDPIFHNGEIWFRGKGTQGAETLYSSRSRADAVMTYFIYSFNLETHQVKLQAMSKCSKELQQGYLRSWCKLPPRHNDKLFEVSVEIQEWSRLDNRCNSVPALVTGFTILLCAHVAQFSSKGLLIPTVYISLVYMAVTMIASGFVEFFANETKTNWFDPWQYLSGMAMLGSAILLDLMCRRQCRRWTASLVRVGAVVYTSGWMDAKLHAVVQVFVIAFPMALLYWGTKEDVGVAAAFLSTLQLLLWIRAETVVVMMGGVLVVLSLRPISFTTTSLVSSLLSRSAATDTVNRISIWGMLIYAVGIWAVCLSSVDDVPVTPLLYNLGVVIPMFFVAWYANSSFACQLAIFSFVLEVCFFLWLAIQLLVQAPEVLTDKSWKMLEENQSFEPVHHGVYAILVSLVAGSMAITKWFLQKQRNIVAEPRNILVAIRRLSPSQTHPSSEDHDNGDDDDDNGDEEASLTKQDGEA